MKRLIIILTFLMLASPVYAGFTISADTVNHSICPTTTELVTIELINRDANFKSYNFGLSGDASQWTVMAPSGITLAPNERGSIYLYITPSMYAQTGNYNLKFIVSSSGRTENINFNIEVPDCNGLSISTQNTQRTVCSGNTGDFSLDLNNDGRWTENYDLLISGEAAQWGSLSKTSMTLSSGESEEFNLYVIPDDGEYGDFSVTVTAQSRTTNAVVSKELTLTSEDCFDFDLSASENFASFCDNSEVKIPLTVDNFGSEQNSFELQLTGTSWSSLSTDQFSISARSSKTFDLILVPGSGTTGNYQFEIITNSLNSDKTDSTIITTNILSCRKSIMTVATDSIELCPGDSKTVEVLLLNSGRFEETYALSTSGISWLKLDESLIKLNSEESESVELTFLTDYSVQPGKFKASIIANVQNIEGNTLKSEVDVIVKDLKSCYSVSADTKSTVELGIGTGTLVPITLKNTGARSDNYQLTLTGDAIQYAQLNPGTVSINGNSEKTVYLFISLPRDAELGLYNLNLVAESDRSSTRLPINILAKQGGIDRVVSNINKLTGETTLKITSAFNSFTSKVSNLIGISSNYFKNLVISEDSYLVKYWYIFPVVLLIMILSMFRNNNNDSWMKDLELLEKDIEIKSKNRKTIFSQIRDNWRESQKRREKTKVVTKIISKPKKKQVKPKSKKSYPLLIYWKKFNKWMNEEIDVPINQNKKVKPKSKKKQVKPKPKNQDNIWKKFLKWLDSESKPKKKRVKSKIKKVKSSKSIWQKFLDWLDEE